VHPRENGFTLIELMVALAVSGVVVLTAAGIFAAVGDAGREVRVAREKVDREMNARRWLAATFLSLDVGQQPAGPFEGKADRVTFSAFQQATGGWLEERRVTLGKEGSELVATIQPGEPLAFADSVADVAFDYLLEPGLNSTWVREWISPVSAPLAVRMRVQSRRGTDTLLFLIKERG
jgi:prepilin-type N-terminal cleavage/methylation domain-containing protein